MKTLLAAARNNAEWCDAVCRAQGAPGAFAAGLWANRHATPRYYPNAITLAPGNAKADAGRILALRDAGLAPGWGVKDSFHELNLAADGFRLLFEAEWLRLAAEVQIAGRDDAGHLLTWRRMTSSADLTAWEEAWAAGETGPRVFLDGLLADEHIAFIAGEHEGRIEAGAVANLHAGIVGLSNAFMRTPARGAWRRLVSEVRATFPGVDIVDYQRIGESGASTAIGFEVLGPLRIWEFGAI